MKLDPWQKDFLKIKGDKILCTGRQVGKSEVCSMDAGEYAVRNKGTKPIVMIAPTERQAFALFSKTLSYLLKKYPHLVSRKKTETNKTQITLRTGTKIYCLPVGSSGLGIRFLTIGRLYVDEASRIPEDVWDAITPALLTTGGATVLLSTPQGAQGEFYRVWVNKDKAYDSFTRISTNSEKVVREREICDSWTQKQRDKALVILEQAKKRMSNARYAQEYMGEFIEGFHRWFSDELIQKSCVLKRRERLLPYREYYMGCDIARMGEDEGTFEILDRIDRDNIVQVESIITKKKLTNETEDRIVELDKRYDFSKIFIDAGAGSLGVSVFDHLLILDQTKRKVIAINNAKRSVDNDDRKVRLLKEDLYDNLRALMEQGRIKLLDDDEVVESLRSIQYEYVMREGEPTRLKIWGDYAHVVEGLIRAAWCVKYKNLNIKVYSIKI